MIKKLSTKLIPDPKRVVLMFFQLNKARTKRVIKMVSSLEESKVQKIQNRFDKITYKHVRRDDPHQKHADYLLNQKLDETFGKKKEKHPLSCNNL